MRTPPTATLKVPCTAWLKPSLSRKGPANDWGDVVSTWFSCFKAAAKWLYHCWPGGRRCQSIPSSQVSGLKTLYKQINLTAGVHQVLNQLGPWRTMARVSLQRNPKPVFWNLRCWPILEKPTTKLRLRRKDFSIALSPEKTSKLRRSWAGFFYFLFLSNMNQQAPSYMVFKYMVFILNRTG